MRKATYFAVFEPAPEGAFGVSFPDLPGCVSYGSNFEEAQHMADEALGLHLWGMEKDHEDIPAPTFPPFEDMPSDVIVVPVTVFPDLVRSEMNNRAVKTNITLPAWLKEMAEDKGINFSKLLQETLKEHLGIQH